MSATRLGGGAPVLRHAIAVALAVLLVAGAAGPASAGKGDARGTPRAHGGAPPAHAAGVGLGRCDADRDPPRPHARALGLRRCRVDSDEQPSAPPAAPRRPGASPVPGAPPAPPAGPEPVPTGDGRPAGPLPHNARPEFRNGGVQRPSGTRPTVERSRHPEVLDSVVSRRPAHRPGAASPSRRSPNDGASADPTPGAVQRPPLAVVAPLVPEVLAPVDYASHRSLPWVLVVAVALSAVGFVVGRRRDAKLSDSAQEDPTRDLGFS